MLYLLISHAAGRVSGSDGSGRWRQQAVEAPCLLRSLYGPSPVVFVFSESRCEPCNAPERAGDGEAFGALSARGTRPCRDVQADGGGTWGVEARTKKASEQMKGNQRTPVAPSRSALHPHDPG